MGILVKAMMLKAVVEQWNRLLSFLHLFSARELELEDRQSRLQQELRERMAVEGEYRNVTFLKGFLLQLLPVFVFVCLLLVKFSKLNHWLYIY